MGKTESFSPKVKNKTSMSTLTVLIKCSTGSLSHSNQTTKRNYNQISKEEVKLSLSADDIILYIWKTQKAATKNC